MKRKITLRLAVIFTALLCGCQVKPTNDPIGPPECFEITIIEGCEYIVYRGVGSQTYSGVTHKGNCKNH